MNENLSDTLNDLGYHEATPMEVYRSIFRLGDGYIQTRNEPPGLNKTNPIIIGKTGERSIKQIMFEDEFENKLAEFQQLDNAYMNGITYWGNERTAERQSRMFALIFDLDDVTRENLRNLLDGMSYEVYPTPNYIVTSGHGLHLYYVFEQPVCLYPNTKTQLKNLKYALTDVLWNKRTSSDENVQHQPINQAFRVVGGKTKIDGIVARAFTISEHPTTIDYLNSFVDKKDQVDINKVYKDSKVTLDEARELFPDWYERVVINKEPPGGWKSNRGLYDWWKSKIFDGATKGHRYFCLMALAIFAIKCRIPEDELRRDANSFVYMLSMLGNGDELTEYDVICALECYDDRYRTFPKKDLEKLTGIPMPSKKRNYQDRHTHLQADYWNIDGKWIENPCKRNREKRLSELREQGMIHGRPKGSGTKEQEVADYFRNFPNASVRSAAKALGISRTTVQKWKPK